MNNKFKSATAFSIAVFTTGCLKTEFTFPSVSEVVGTPQSCTVSDANLIASNIRNTVTIFGVTGSFIPTYSELDFVSSMHRSKGFQQISWLQDAAATTPFAVSTTGYTAVTNMATDHDEDATGTQTADRVNRTGWAARTCGTTGSLVDRIDDCDDEFGANATWDGNVHGTSGEAVWKLVARTADLYNYFGREVWQDQRTKLVWSSLVSKGASWCMATGKSTIMGNPAAETDPDGTCGYSWAQVTSGPAVSACFEDGGVNFSNIDTVNAAPGNIDSAGKAGLGLASTPAVHWRLPTRNDYYQAEVDGIRFVMPDALAFGDAEWTTTVNTLPTSEAYAFNSQTGEVISIGRDAGIFARCVGR